MEIFIFIVICFIIIMFFSKTKEKSNDSFSKSLLLQDPLYSISKKGFLGFKIGDSFKFVWSRIMYLGLMTQKEIEQYEMEIKYGFGSFVTVGKNKFAEIDKITMRFDQKSRLNCIMVYVKNKPNTLIKDYMKEIKDRYVRILGEPIINDTTTYQWAFIGNKFVMFYENNQIIIDIFSPR